MPAIPSQQVAQTQTHRLPPSDFFRRAVGDACGGRGLTVGGERRRLPQDMGDKHLSQVVPGRWQGPKHVCRASPCRCNSLQCLQQHLLPLAFDLFANKQAVYDSLIE
jgi:hypothetical protein